MKIILRDNVETLGNAGDLVTVKDGYARNYLMPRNLAYPATERNLRVWADEKRKFLVRVSKETLEAEKVKASLEAVHPIIPMQVGEEGRLFGSVTNRDVAEALKQHGFDVDHRQIAIDEPIRMRGSFEVVVRLAHGVTATVQGEVTDVATPSAPVAEAPVADVVAEGTPEVE
jgi:large subunit ribosomal protein L9